jgi:protein O-mannosyl-transferase
MPTPGLLATAAIVSLLLLAVLLVFGQTAGYDFVNFDDNDYVYDNAAVNHGLSPHAIAWAFTTACQANWHPLTWISHMVDCQIYGLHAGGHHATNVLLHAAAAIGLFLVLRRMTGDFWPSALVAALFAVHPLRVESVAWVAERKDVLSGLLFVATLAAYVAYVRHPFSWLRYLFVVGLFALALMAKPAVVTLPCVLLLLDYWPLGRIAGTGPFFGRKSTLASPLGVEDMDLSPSAARGGQSHFRGYTSIERRASVAAEIGTFPWRLLVEKIPLFVLTVVSCVVTPLAQGIAVAPLAAIPMRLRIANALVAYVAYLGQFFYPVGLTVFYPHAANDLPLWKIFGALAVLIAITLAAIAGWRRYPYLLVGWFWYLGMLVPMIGLVQVGDHAMADRYTYLPQIGLCIALAWGMAHVVAVWPRSRWACSVACALAVLCLMGCAWRQTSHWRNSESLWTHALACNPRNAAAYSNLGNVLTARGKTAEAMDYYRRAIELNPSLFEAYNNLGSLLAASGHINEAITAYGRALQLRPDDFSAHYNLAGDLAACGRTNEAIAHFQEAIRLQPGLVEAHNNFGNLLASLGRLDEAALHLQQALNLQPDSAVTHNNLANIRATQGKLAAAVAHYQKALELQPDFPEAYANLALALQRQGQTAEAVRNWHAAIRLMPDQIVWLNQLAWLRATSPESSSRDGAEALALAGRAQQLSGGHEPAVLDTLAAAQAESRRFPEAVRTAQQALELATQQGNAALAKSIRTRLSLYEAGTPFREKPQPHSTTP